VPWTTSAAALNRNLLLVLKPILGEPLLSIVHMTYFTGTGDTEAAKLSDIVLSPVYRASGANNVIAKFYIKCNDKDDIVNPEWSFDGSENFTFWVEKETGTINSKQYTHIAYIYEDSDLFEYNENEEEVFATNQKLKFVLSYRSKNGSKTFRRTLSLTVGPVARMTTTADTFMNQASGTTTTLTMKVEEYVLVGSTITKVTKTPIFNTNDDEYIIELPDGASEPTTRYKFKLDFWQGTGSTDQFKTYFEIESITGSSVKVRVKDNVTAPVGTLDAFINCTYLPNTNLKYYNDSVATVQVRDNMTISGIHYWTATPTEGNFYGAMSLDKAFMPPVERTAGTDDDKWTLRMYIKLRDTTTMTVSTATFSIASPYNEEIETTIVKSGGTIDTTVGT